MIFISSLVDLCDTTRNRLERRRYGLIKALPKLPDEFAKTPAGIFYLNLKPTTDSKEVDEFCVIADTEIAKRNAIEKSLEEEDVSGRLRKIESAKVRLSDLQKQVKDLETRYSDENVAKLILARKDARDARTEAEDYAARVFESALVEGIGQESWHLMWEQARTYSDR
jgi:hypothetical protein